MRSFRGGNPVTDGNGDGVRPLLYVALDDSRCGGVLVAGVLETAIADQHDPGEIHLIAIGLGAPVSACGTVVVDVRLVAAVRARSGETLHGPRDGDSANRG